MKSSFAIAFDERWRAARLNGEQAEVRELGDSLADTAAVRQALQEWGLPSGPVCLALPSKMVVSARVNGSDVPRNGRRNGLLCLLEEQLPLDIESMTADFLPAVDNWALGVAVESAKVKPLVDALEAAGIEVAAICPLALLALWELCQSGENCDYALIRSEAMVDIFRLRSGKPVAWYTVPDDRREIIECVRADQLGTPLEGESATAWVIAEPDWAIEDLRNGLGLKTVLERPETGLAAATRVAGAAIEGGAAGWINLRRGELSLANPWTRLRGLRRSATVLGLLLPAVLAAMFCWRGLQYGAAADRAVAKEAAAYRKSHDNQPVPHPLNARLRSDLARLTGISGATGQIPPRVNALESLRQVVAALDPSMRLRVLEMRIGPGDVFLEGQTREHGDAEAVAGALAAHGFVLEPPNSESLASGGVGFTLAGQPPPPVSPPASPSDSQPDSAPPTTPEAPPAAAPALAPALPGTPASGPAPAGDGAPQAQAEGSP